MMFQRLNKMFVGEVTSPNQEPEFSEKEDDEWILVDFIDTCTGFSAEEEEEEDDDISEESPTEHTSVFSCLPASLECLADTSDSCFLQFESCPMEESWFITPPPCFTAGGLTAVKVETSPMENLLIEHPSMSVYAVHSSCPGLSEASCVNDDYNPSSPRMGAQSDMGEHIHCCVTALAAQATFLEQPKSFRPSQWIKGHSERQSLNRNGLRRQNLTRDCHTRQVKHSGWVVHQPCPRQYQY
ncbi:tumor protein p53-inducible nuclear protein 1 isoform X1 [Arvicola amphibius]|uniref:tumor protein p53-inducible nuclear protein 1 isoform X1 n=1 Tax=Arvicola amphibius TaxID=1047088 RepID=UPI0018E3EF63|nr:tumor protein p53-inducible nuclear protein 1 isoform X1 [Arvicola amphibius]XP_038203312.1 tumor protein p53-inducible nuclear protein 1 isoform X1 [Arvicola amphibius]XP_038203313.1 tumor protein p53-inducible nuclear protein 1 isoform X1 [Arvicola amphibius]